MSKKADTKATDASTTENEVLTADAESEAEAAEETEAIAEVKEDATADARDAEQESRVYCGPSVRGVAKQYTVFSGETPELLAGFIKEHPAAGALIVPTERFAEVRRKLETAGTAEAILYKQIKSEL